MEKIKSKLYDLSSNIDDYFYYDKEELLKEESYSLGVEHGIEKGIEQGIEQGANQKEQEIIKTMFSNGLSPSKIHEITNIPLDTIEKLAK